MPLLVDNADRRRFLRHVQAHIVRYQKPPRVQTAGQQRPESRDTIEACAFDPRLPEVHRCYKAAPTRISRDSLEPSSHYLTEMFVFPLQLFLLIVSALSLARIHGKRSRAQLAVNHGIRSVVLDQRSQ
jgi:hypothetical protein